MNRNRCRAFLLVCFLFACPLVVMGGVDEESIFSGARRPASELDLQLMYIQKGWWERYVSSPDEETKRRHPLITKAGVGIQLDYFGDDRISATGWVSNRAGFLRLSPEERKKLVYDTLAALKSGLFMASTLVDKETGRFSGSALENRHIKLTMIINDVMRNDKGENIRLSLPSDMGIGQAAYKDGQFVFSETYFLNLRVKGEVAVSGESGKFLIEHE